MLYRWKNLMGVLAMALCTMPSPGTLAAGTQIDELSLNALFGAEEMAANVNAVRRKAADMPAEDRYEYLSNWVLPSRTHADFRVVGEFTPTDPSPLALQLEPYRFASNSGGDLVSPVFDLLETAAELGRLEELQTRVDQIEDPADPGQLRAKFAVQVLINLARGESSETRENLMNRLNALMLESFKSAPGANQPFACWPELLLVVRAMRVHSEFQLIGDLLGTLYAERATISRSTLLNGQLHALMGECQQTLSSGSQGGNGELPPLKTWIPVTQTINMTRGEGYPQTRWVQTEDHHLTLASGKHEAYLFYRSPLAGHYEIFAEMGSVAICQLLAGGQFYGTQGDGKQFVTGTFRQGGRLVPIEYPSGLHEASVRYRAVSDETEVRVSVDGQQCVTYQKDEIPDPWIGVRSMPTIGSTYQNLVISGEPEVLDELPLFSSPSLSNWLAYYLFQETVGFPDAGWSLMRDENDGFHLQARRRPELSGSFCESVLFYQRPLVEDGSIEYDFWYVPGQCDAHPAIDRLVFLIQPEGVKLHWLTDGKYDRTDVAPDHSLTESRNRLSSGPLPLRSSGWNRMRLEYEGETVILKLNGIPIYRRTLESSNHRTFGLFHYADRTELKVRKAVMRGDWPKTVLPIAQQELADRTLVELESGLTNLNSEFRHDFVKDGLPQKFFKLTGKQLDTGVMAREDGVHVQLNSVTGWTVAAIMPQFQLSGDFDIRVRFELRDMDDRWRDGLAFLEARLADDQSHYFRTLRGRQPDVGQTVRSQVLWGPLDERRRINDEREICLAESGCLRVSRIGDRLYSSFAQEDSSVFRVLRTEVLTSADVEMSGILLELALRDEGSGHVIWKDLTIKAERIRYLAPDQKPIRKLFAMSPDGTNLRELTAPKFGLDHLGSPQFSADGSRIVMDMSTGPTTTSHIVIMNRDGSDMKDLGLGCMPSLSRDGKSVVFTDPRAGIVRIDAEGENRETLDRSGWGVQYSPDGKYIAYGSSSNITLIDTTSDKRTELFAGDLANRYSRVYWNFGWSHDSRAIAFKGSVRATGEQELAVVEIGKPDKVEVLYSGAGIYEDFTFSPDNQSVLFALRQEGPTQPDLYLAHRKTPGQIERLKGQPDEYRIFDSDWSPDGKEIVFAAPVDPVPSDWPPAETTTETQGFERGDAK